MIENPNRHFYNQAEIARARTVALVPYLQRHDPQQILSASENALELRDYGHLELKGGRWYCPGQNAKGANALDYLVTLKHWNFPTAVAELLKDLAEASLQEHEEPSALIENETMEEEGTADEPYEEDDAYDETEESSGRGVPFFHRHFIP